MSMSETTVAEEQLITIGEAATPREKEEVYRLRYQIYVEEMAMQLASVDHGNGLLYDQLDEWAILLYAKIGSHTVGTIRANIGTLANFPADLATFLSLNRFQHFYDKTGGTGIFAYTSKLMIAPQYRNTSVLHLLTAKAYELGCGHVQFCFGLCNFHLIRLYEKIGWRRFNQPFTAPGYDGVLLPLVLIMDDTEYFRAIRSPLYRLARKRKVLNTSAAGWFNREFAECSSPLNSPLISEEELWLYFKSKLRNEPQLAIDVLKGLSSAEARQFLHLCSFITCCSAGDPVILRGCTSHSMYILISGKLFSNFTGSRIDIVQPGQCFGATGLVCFPKFEEDVYAFTAAEIAVISRLSFQKYQHAHPQTASKILRNLELYGCCARQ